MSTSSVNMTIATHTNKGVNFNLEANQIHEFIPQPLETTENQTPMYTSTPIPRNPRRTASMIPRKDILFDLWNMRKIDQRIRNYLEYSMIKSGFLKPRFNNH